MPLRLGHLGQIDLLLEVFHKRSAALIQRLVVRLVGGVIALTASVIRRLVIVDIVVVVELVILERVGVVILFVEVFLLNLLCLYLFRIATFFQRRILLQFLVDTLLQITRRQFK